MPSAWAVLVLMASAGWILRDASGITAALELLAHDLVSPGPYFTVNTLAAVRSLVVTAVVVLGSDALGVGLGTWWLGRRPAGVARCVMPLVGHFTLSAVLLGLAACGLWQPILLSVVAALALLLGIPSIRRSAKEWACGAEAAWRALPAVARLPALAGVALLVVVTLPPETGIDALAYHLAFPDQLLVTRRLFGTDGYSHWLFPLPVELPHVFSRLADADAAAVWTGLVMGGAGALAVARALGAGAAAPWLAAAALLVSGPRWMLLTAKNDAHAAGLMLAAAALLADAGPLARRPAGHGRIALAGALLGAAVAAKYVLIPLAAIIGLVAWWRARAADRGPVIAVMALGAAVPLAPWLVKGWLYLADPFYPMGSAFFPAWFGDNFHSAVRRSLLDQHVRDPAHFAAAPGMLGRMLVGDLPLLLAGAFWLRKFSPPGGGGLAAAALLAVGGAAFLLRGDFATVDRYAYPVLVLANLAGAAAIVRAGSAAARWALAMLATIAVLRLPADDTGGRPGAWLAGALDAAGYRALTLLPRAGLEPALRKLAAGGRGSILAVGELALHRLPRRAKLQVFEPPLAWTASRDAPDWRRVAVRFKQADVRWILHNPSLAWFAATVRPPWIWEPAQLRRYADFCARHVRVNAFGGAAVGGWGSAWLLDVSARPKPPVAAFPLLPGTESAFASPVLADVNGNPRWAAEWWYGWQGVLPDVGWIDARWGGSLLRAGRPHDALVRLRRADATGLVDEALLLDLAMAWHRTGHRHEALTALRRAREFLSGWPERFEAANREIMGTP